MTPSQLIPDLDTRPEPFRWTRSEATHTLHDFQQAHTSQRQFAQQHGVPRSTLQSWQQRCQHPDLQPELVRFLESPVGYHFLRRLVLALHVVFHQGGHAGLRPLGDFLRLSQLDHFVAPSYGAQQALASQLQDHLITFATEERTQLAATMTDRDITVCLDENFHGGQMCLVAIEPLSNFILVEAYRDHRDGLTWTTTLQEAVVGLPIKIMQMTSDQAKGLLSCARDGFAAHHSPDLFHVQQELTHALSLSLQRQTAAAIEELAVKQGQTLKRQQELQQYEQGPKPVGRPPDLAAGVEWCQRWEVAAESALAACQQRQEQSQQAVRGLADDYHPFDATTGQEVTASVAALRLNGHLDKVETVVAAAQLGERAQAAVARVRRWLPKLVATVAWYWIRTRLLVEGLSLSEAAEQAIYQQLLPGLYWQTAAGRGRDKEQQEQRRALAERLLEEAWSPSGPLGKLSKEEQGSVRGVAAAVQGMFCRSSSCVEGRNGQLSLHHHGQGGLTTKRLQALTAVHNYVVERDGTTAAERFFGRKPRDVFAWLLDRLPELPRPVLKAKKADKP